MHKKAKINQHEGLPGLRQINGKTIKALDNHVPSPLFRTRLLRYLVHQVTMLLRTLVALTLVAKCTAKMYQFSQATHSNTF